MSEPQETPTDLLAHTKIRRPEVRQCMMDPIARTLLRDMGPEAAMAHPPDAALEPLCEDRRRAYLRRHRPLGYRAENRVHIVSPIFGLDRQRRLVPNDRKMYVDLLPTTPSATMVMKLLELDHLITPAMDQGIVPKWSWLLASNLMKYAPEDTLYFRGKKHFSKFYGVHRQCL